ncbi:nitric oxide reductase subunit C [Ardenticatena maritima]|uniref:Nitric oxide reductase subunit C n=1 Tax=Ardenticatena maritima TaxID=872965 RepID=A0A0M8K8S9_9CHLR|nr:cytochrome c [Ardenticatena maritima]KPL86420.1 hypothetical protein SE16_14050 [Ardenticatena maritima]GAP64095.1 nitric oxide reductase subunit C [Ardenticatena maritima]
MKRYAPLGILVVLILVVWFWVSPPRFWLNMTKRVAPSPEVGAQLVEKYGCRGCHTIGGQGAILAPNLDQVVRRNKEEDPAFVTLRLWLRDPTAVKPNTAMPNFKLSDTEIEAILQYLQTQAEQAAE